MGRGSGRADAAGATAWARRYPALAYLGGAVALALLLPSGLTLPNSGPATLAEYAPVPGSGDGRSDVAAFSQASSRGGPGFGPGSGGQSATSPTTDGAGEVAPGRIVRRPGTKRCVGDPPRQTEDPLSPPCVAFFDGDNGGATAKGVTRDEVAVAVRVDVDVRTGALPLVDCASAPTSDDDANTLYCKAFHRFFNDRYQTYNRTVRLFLAPNFKFKEVDARRPLFAWLGNQDSSEAARSRTISVTYSGASRGGYQSLAPYRISYRPDLEDVRAMTATYICSKLHGRPARFAGDPDLQRRTRRFAIWYEDDGRAERDRMAKLLHDTCGLTFDDEQQGANAGSDATKGVTGASRMRTNNITSVVLMASAAGYVTTSATQAGWFPEWIVPGYSASRRVDTNIYARNADQSQWRNAFGISMDIRRDAVNDQPWFRAFREGCPDCREPDTLRGTLGPELYDSLSLLFYGIQAAGPRLSAENVDKGLHAIPPRASDDPYRPAAYFAPGNYSFVKDAMAIWWDPAGQPPGAGTAGCYRLPHEGRRSRAGSWPPGDGDVKRDGPCQGDTVG